MTIAQPRPPAVSLIRRTVLREPVRLYCALVATTLIAVLIVVGLITGRLLDDVVVLAVTAVAFTAAGIAVVLRPTVYSTAGLLDAVRAVDAARQLDAAADPDGPTLTGGSL